MSSEIDPRDLLRQHEQRVLAHLKHTAGKLAHGPRRCAPRAIEWVRGHPRASLTIATGTGFVLAGGRGSTRTGALKQNAAQVAMAGKLMLIGRLARSLSGAWNSPAVSGAATDQVPGQAPAPVPD